jgi:hypothetical protein
MKIKRRRATAKISNHRDSKRNLRTPGDQEIAANWNAKDLSTRRNYAAIGLDSAPLSLMGSSKNNKPKKEVEFSLTVPEPPPKTTTILEITDQKAATIAKLLERCGDDYKKMARDKFNVYQWTEKQAQKACEDYATSLCLNNPGMFPDEEQEGEEEEKSTSGEESDE